MEECLRKATKAGSKATVSGTVYGYIIAEVSRAKRAQRSTVGKKMW